jgi:two-component system chemotaxis response regulator CheY
MRRVALIVEDSGSMRQLIAMSLRRIPGLEILEASNGFEALRRLGEPPVPDILLIDINMPEMDGLKLVARVRSDERLKHVPIIIVTTEGSAEDYERAMALGANEYLTKPIQGARLLAKVKGLLKVE